MSCEAVNEVVIANRSECHLLEPANTPGTFEAVSLMRRRCAEFHRALGGTSRCIRAGYMAAPGSFHSVNSLALGEPAFISPPAGPSLLYRPAKALDLFLPSVKKGYTSHFDAFPLRCFSRRVGVLECAV